jgi:DNA-binding NtrC family response regulator
LTDPTGLCPWDGRPECTITVTTTDPDEKTLILNALSQAGGKIVKTAAILGISDSYLRRRIKDLKIQLP